MSQISEDIARIRGARYGKDVRESIADGIEQCYKDATGHPDSVAAAITAIDAIADRTEKAVNANNALLGEISKKYETEEVITPTVGTEMQDLMNQAESFYKWDKIDIIAGITNYYFDTPASEFDQIAVYAYSANDQAIKKYVFDAPSAASSGAATIGEYIFRDMDIDDAEHTNISGTLEEVELTIVGAHLTEEQKAVSERVPDYIEFPTVRRVTQLKISEDGVEGKYRVAEETIANLALSDIKLNIVDIKGIRIQPEKDAELVDLRTKSDGTVTRSAGQAVREQITKLKSDLDELQQGGYIADQQQIGKKVNSWLNEHPEATTTVQDGSLTLSKLKNGQGQRILYSIATYTTEYNDPTKGNFYAIQASVDGLTHTIIPGTEYFLGEGYTNIGSDWQHYEINGVHIFTVTKFSAKYDFLVVFTEDFVTFYPSYINLGLKSIYTDSDNPYIWTPQIFEYDGNTYLSVSVQTGITIPNDDYYGLENGRNVNIFALPVSIDPDNHTITKNGDIIQVNLPPESHMDGIFFEHSGYLYCYYKDRVMEWQNLARCTTLDGVFEDVAVNIFRQPYTEGGAVYKVGNSYAFTTCIYSGYTSQKGNAICYTDDLQNFYGFKLMQHIGGVASMSETPKMRNPQFFTVDNKITGMFFEQGMELNYGEYEPPAYEVALMESRSKLWDNPVAVQPGVHLKFRTPNETVVMAGNPVKLYARTPAVSISTKEGDCALTIGSRTVTFTNNKQTAIYLLSDNLLMADDTNVSEVLNTVSGIRVILSTHYSGAKCLLIKGSATEEIPFGTTLLSDFSKVKFTETFAFLVATYVAGSPWSTTAIQFYDDVLRTTNTIKEGCYVSGVIPMI